MFKYYLLLIIRNIKRSKSIFFINLIGLSTGLTCALLIFLWINGELNVNKLSLNDDRVFQVMRNFHDGNVYRTTEDTPGILADALAKEIPDIEYAVSVVPASWFPEKGILKIKETLIKVNAQYIDKNYFKIFSFPLIATSNDQPLNDKYGIVITKSLAIKIFGDTNSALGKTVEWNQGTINGVFQITGIINEPPVNSTEKFEILLSYDIFLDTHPWLKEWGNSDPNTFILVKQGADVVLVNSKIKNLITSISPDSDSDYFIQKYSDRYLYGKYENGIPSGGRIEYVRLFSIIALFILIIACINFMNLSTAAASKRTLEVGVKKVMGSSRLTLIIQYIGESLLITFLSLVLSIFLVLLILPIFNEITGKHLVLSPGLKYFIILPVMLLFTGIISGSYPALYISGFKPIEVLKGKLKGSIAEFLTRKGLVIFQFVISVTMIISVFIVYRQIEFIQSKNLGYNRNNVIHFNAELNPEIKKEFLTNENMLQKDMGTFINEAKKIPGVINISNYYHDLTGNCGEIRGVNWKAGDEDDKMNFANLEVGYNFIETLGIQMLQGRNFSPSLNNEISKVIFNEEAIKQMGLKNPVGKTIKVWGQEKQIIGVTKNFNFESLFENIKPCIIQLDPCSPHIMAKISSKAQKESIAQLKQLFQQRNPGLAFEYKFVDEDYQALYETENRIKVISRYFTGIAILISCLGLFGLATFSAEKRRKEISIRKIFGANKYAMMNLLTHEFIRIVIYAILISVPLSYLIMHKWLESFAFKINISWWIFAFSGILALGITLLTISWQSWQAARKNPVEALRYE